LPEAADLNYWRRRLSLAADSAAAAVEASLRSGKATRLIGVGAAGDRTMRADKAAEKAILSSLSKAGGMRFLSEEAGEVGPRSAGWLAVVDPLDGSSNFSRGIGFYCTSIALADGPSLSDVRYGMIRNLAGMGSYFASRGGGAFSGEERTVPSKTDSLSEAVVIVDTSRSGEGAVVRLEPLIAATQRQIHFGAAALEACMLAEGKVDAYIDIRGRMRVTDFASAYLILKESGAIVTAPDGSDLDPKLNLAERFGFVAASSRSLHSKILELIR
jgi:myo-inositol-1(or 4)-monophosphatase